MEIEEKVFDLADLAATEIDSGVEMIPVHPVHGPLRGMSLTVISMESKVMRTEMRKMNDATTRRIRQNLPTLSSEEIEDNASGLIARAVVAWRGFNKDGQPLPFSYEAILALLKDRRYSWLRKQISDYITTDAHFFGK